jgi:hypothetical protein
MNADFLLLRLVPRSGNLEALVNANEILPYRRSFALIRG